MSVVPYRAPGARVRSVRELVEWLDTFQPGATGAVRAAMDSEVRVRFDALLPSDYLAISDDRHVIETICRHVGEAHARAVWRGYAARLAQSPLFRTLIEGTRRLAGTSPRLSVRILPTAWAANYRGCGVCTGTWTATESLIDFSELHPVICASPAYFWGWHGTLEGMQDILATNAVVEGDFRPEARMMHFTIRH